VGRPAIRALTILTALAAACGESTPASPSADAPVRVLMVTATLGFRHDSIPVARDVMAQLAGSTGEFTVTTTENLGDVTAARLVATDVLMFALTSGELPLDANQRSAILSFVNGGGGFIGVHSAADTLYEWPEYGQLVGAYFNDHPYTQEAAVIVEDATHPSTATLGSRFVIKEEFYRFRSNPRPAAHVLLSLDAGSVGGTGDFPLAWTHDVSNGRAYYNALGHFEETWKDSRFQAQMRGAIKWVARR
jgi:type 1 glutamine amidotransferase